jgi:hypothetical protein
MIKLFIISFFTGLGMGIGFIIPASVLLIILWWITRNETR